MTLRYLFISFCSVILTLIAYCFSWLIALFVDSSGNLPYLLRWFQTSDAPCYGDAFWAKYNSTYSRYKLIITWLMRNPAQGFDQYSKASVTMNTVCKVRGNIEMGDTVGVSGYYLITCATAFHFAAVVPIGFGKCAECGFGWRLNNIVKGYPHNTMGQLVFTPIRFQNFGK